MLRYFVEFLEGKWYSFTYWLDERWVEFWRVPNEPSSLPLDLEGGGKEWMSGWDSWRKEAAKKYPIRHFMSWTFHIWYSRLYRRWVTDTYYYLKTFVFERYNHVEITTLPRTWSEWDTRMLHACFALLVDFSENGRDDHMTASREQLIEWYDYTYEGQPEEDRQKSLEHAQKRADEWMELQRLLAWWKEYSSMDEEDYEEKFYHSNGEFKAQEYIAAHNKMEEEVNNNLASLIRLRENLWT